MSERNRPRAFKNESTGAYSKATHPPPLCPNASSLALASAPRIGLTAVQAAGSAAVRAPAAESLDNVPTERPVFAAVVRSKAILSIIAKLATSIFLARFVTQNVTPRQIRPLGLGDGRGLFSGLGVAAFRYRPSSA